MNKEGEITLPNVQAYYIATLDGWTHRSIEQNREPRNRPTDV